MFLRTYDQSPESSRPAVIGAALGTVDQFGLELMQR